MEPKVKIAVLSALLAMVMPWRVEAQVGRAVYAGEPAAVSGIVLGAWGSGNAEESVDHVVSGSKCIKIVSQGFYSGGRIDFSQPALVYSGAPAADEYLRFLFTFSGMVTIPSLAEALEPITRPKVEKIRLVIYPDSEDQPPIEVAIPVGSADNEQGWWPIAVPLSLLKAPPESREFKIRRILVFSDVPDTMWIGEISVVKDDVPIEAKMLPDEPQTIMSLDTIAFRAIASGGISPLVYYWDFDKRDGIQEDDFGEQVSHQFKAKRSSSDEPTEYIVTLTVKDFFGIKKPATATVSITVNQ